MCRWYPLEGSRAPHRALPHVGESSVCELHIVFREKGDGWCFMQVFVGFLLGGVGNRRHTIGWEVGAEPEQANQLQLYCQTENSKDVVEHVSVLGHLEILIPWMEIIIPKLLQEFIDYFIYLSLPLFPPLPHSLGCLETFPLLFFCYLLQGCVLTCRGVVIFVFVPCHQGTCITVQCISIIWQICL